MSVTYVYKIARQIMEDRIALLIAILFMSLPLFHSQVEILNMEMPLTMFSILSIYFVTQRKWATASLMAVLAILVKGVGIGIGASVIFAAIVNFFISDSKESKRTGLIWGLITFVFVACYTYVTFYVLHDKADVDMVGPFKGFFKMLRWPLFYIFFASFGLFIFYVSRWLIASKKKWKDVFTQYFVPIVVFVAASSWFIVFINSYGDQYRYRLFLAPFLWIAITYVVFQYLKSRITSLALIGGILIALVGSYGIFFRPYLYNVDAVLERTLEYRDDMNMDIKLARVVSQRYSEFLIGAPFTIAHELAFPELGFVDRKLQVMIYDFPCHYGDVKQFKTAAELDASKTVWIGVQNNLGEIIPFMKGYPVSPKDRVLEEIAVGPRKATLFIGGGYIEKMRLVQIELLKHFAQKGMVKNPYEHNFGL